jgi:hypothetical protein
MNNENSEVEAKRWQQLKTMELNPTPILVVHHPRERFDSMKAKLVEISNTGQPQYEKKRFVFHL